MSTQKGIDYQNYVGVLRILEFVVNPSLLWIEFESQEEAMEDINRFYRNETVYEQVKWRGKKDWTRYEIEKMLSRFIVKFGEYTGTKLLRFQFTTNTQGDKDVDRLYFLLPIIHKSTSIDDLDETQKEAMIVCFPDGTDKITAYTIAKNLDLQWNVGRSDPADPLRGIKEDCINKLVERCSYSGEDGAQVVESLFSEVAKWSTIGGWSRRYEKIEFRKIIPNCGRVEYEKAEMIIPEELLQVIRRFEPTFFDGPENVTVENDSISVSFNMIVDGKEIFIWVLQEGVLDERIERVNRTITDMNQRNFIVILLNERVNKLRFSDSIRKHVIRRHENDSLLRLIERIMNE